MSIPPCIAGLLEESASLELAGDNSAALERAQIALQRARADGDSAVIAATLVRVATVQFRLGHYDRARAAGEEAFARAAPDAPARADALMIQGMSASETDSLADAESLYHRAADLAREIGYPFVRQRALHDLAATVYIPHGQFDLALTADNEALRIVREHNWRESFCPPLTTIAATYQITGQYPLAHSTLDELDQVAGLWQLARGFSLWIRGDLARAEGNPEVALSFYKQAFAVAENLGDPGLNINVRVGMSRHHRAVGNLSDARDWANDAVIYATRVGYRHFHGMALSERGHAAAALGDFAAAEADLRAAVEILTPLQANFDLARTHLLLAWLLSEQAERRREATETFRVAARSIIGGGYAFLLDQERTIALPLVASYLGDADPEMAELASALLAHLERVPALPLRTTTLGRFEVQQGCRCIEERAWRKRSAGELFRLLLISPRRSLTSAEIVEALWSDKSPRSAAEFLHQATSTLRRILEPELPARFASRYVEVEGEQVYLHLPPGSWVDYEIFEQHIQTREWCAALALYQGDLFPGDRYADWVAATRERLSRHYLDALLATAAQHLDAGRAQESLDACHRVLERDPWQENAVLLGMRACLALNDRAGAIRLYRELERTLREELGVSPQPVLQEFCQSLLR